MSKITNIHDLKNAVAVSTTGFSLDQSYKEFKNGATLDDESLNLLYESGLIKLEDFKEPTEHVWFTEISKNPYLFRNCPHKSDSLFYHKLLTKHPGLLQIFWGHNRAEERGHVSDNLQSLYGVIPDIDDDYIEGMVASNPYSISKVHHVLPHKTGKLARKHFHAHPEIMYHYLEDQTLGDTLDLIKENPREGIDELKGDSSIDAIADRWHHTHPSLVYFMKIETLPLETVKKAVGVTGIHWFMRQCVRKQFCWTGLSNDVKAYLKEASGERDHIQFLSSNSWRKDPLTGADLLAYVSAGKTRLDLWTGSDYTFLMSILVSHGEYIENKAKELLT